MSSKNANPRADGKVTRCDFTTSRGRYDRILKYLRPLKSPFFRVEVAEKRSEHIERMRLAENANKKLLLAVQQTIKQNYTNATNYHTYHLNNSSLQIYFFILLIWNCKIIVFGKEAKRI